ncbi:uncharacterized protein LOC133196159 [Saccostrea echinata]|uniref:uncharacterized protein LOC133196159 n=1 Tax=Saccostrea echinata TaxID=191078 RepID=UPI002A7F535F|nr:uncharacterized protein LOC133196159 [Saccostrea echinata]
MDHLPRVSEVLFTGLCRMIGSPTEVAIRRDVKDIVDMMMKPFYRQIGFVQMKSGSYGEGFRLSSSDLDKMFWFCNDKLITDISQARVYNTSKYDIILMEDSDTPPGFWDILVPLAFAIAKSTSCCTHKRVYILDRMICNMLKLAGCLCHVSHSLYLALYYYRTRRYDKSLHNTYLTKHRVSQPYVMIMKTVDRQIYNEAVSNLSLSKKMKTAWVEMLSVLPHYRLGNRSQCLQSVTDLQTLLLYDDGRCIPLETRDISWQILGICQHLVGDLHGALRSFGESCRQQPHHRIQEAIYIRIGCVQRELHRNRQT